MTNFDPLLIAIATPLALALAIALGLPKRWSVRLSYVAFAVPLLMALHVWWHYAAAPQENGYAFLTRYSTGLDGLGIALKLGLNGVSLPLFVLAGIVGFAAGLYAIQSQAERLKIYLMLLLIMQGGLMGVFASVDVFFFYFFHEFALIATFIMVGVWGGRDRSYAAMKMTIYLTAGAMLSLVGLIALYVKSGAHSFDLIELRSYVAAHPLAETVQNNIFGLLMFGLGILVSLWPLHTWAPLGYGAAPSSNAMLHAGVLKKFGLYGLIQIALPLLPAGALHWAQPLAWLAAIGNVIVVGFIAMAQRDLKQMIGYSSVMHMGYAFLGIAAGSVLGVGGVVLLMVAHGLSVALLFLLATSVHHRTHTFALDEMGGLAQQAPVLAALFVAATFASIGLPGFANFWGELTIFVALWQLSPTFAALAVAGVIISAVYGLRAAARVFFGPATERFGEIAAQHPPTDLRWAEKFPALVLLAALLFVGFWPKSLSEPINATLTAPAQQPSGLANAAEARRVKDNPPYLQAASLAATDVPSR
ncbi:MAG TPA: NADH-quinone oxidoreductase subunit M [Opitutaceae bacterium]|nr:NADH-quinone oxidoreductase subunit M [Opitutaceae bacterium]